MTTLGAHEVLILCPEARERWRAAFHEDLAAGFDLDHATGWANQEVVRLYRPEAQRRHDEAVKRTLEGG